MTLSDATPGATIYYTTNGASPSAASTPYIGPIALASSETITAAAVAQGYSQSPSSSASYIVLAPAATPILTPAASTFTTTQTVYITDTTPAAAIYYTTDGTSPSVSSTRYTGPIAVAATETIRATAVSAGYSQSPSAAGTYTLTPPAAAPVLTPAGGSYTSSQSVTIADSTPAATIYYTIDGSAPTALSLQYNGAIAVVASEQINAMAVAPGFSPSATVTGSYTIMPPTATPVISPAAGSYSGPQSVSIADSTSGAAIYFTTDGTTPGASSTPYIGPIPVSSTVCLHAIAVAPGFSPSAVASAAFSFPAPLAIATAPSLPGGFVGAPYAMQIVAAGAGPNYLWSVNGVPVVPGGTGVQLPGGVGFSSKGNYALAIGGKPSLAGTVAFSVTVTDAHSGQQAGPVAFSIPVATPTAPSLPAPTPPTLGPATAHISYAGFLGVTGGVPPYQWTVTGLPGTFTWVTADPIATVAGSGVAGFSGDGSPALGAQINASGGVAVDGGGNLYISDAVSSRVRMVSPQGVISTVAGTGTAGYNGDNIPAAQAQLNAPAGLAVDRAGNLYIADSANARIRMVSAATGQIVTVAGTGTAGYNGDNLAATVAELQLPTGVAVDNAGDFYIADSGNARVREVSAASGEITTVAGTGIAGFSGDAGPATAAQLKNPDAVAVDSQGNLYIADLTGAAGATRTGGRIRQLSFATGTINTVAGNGITGYNGDGIAAIKAQLNDPVSIATDAGGNLYIADAGNDRVRAVSGGIIRTIIGTGVAGFNGDAALAIGANVAPQGVATDGAGNVYVADNGNRVRLVPAPGKNSVLAIEGTPATAGTLAFQASVQDATGTSAGPVSYSINVSNPLPLALPAPNPGTLPAAVAGQPYSGSIVVSGGVPGYNWYINGSRTPAGPSPASLTGGLTYAVAGNRLSIGGTPLSSGVLSLSISIIDGMGKTAGPILYSIYVMSAPGYQVSGEIGFLNCGAPAGGIAVAIGTSPPQITSTDINGQFAFENVPAGNYTVTPSSTAPSSVFVPASQTAVVRGSGAAGIDFSAELGYTVSGSVSLPAGIGGRTYVNLINQSCPESLLGTSVNYSTGFAIRGVQPGNYTLQAWTDELGYGARNESSPTQSISNLVVGNANLGLVAVTPVAAAPVAVSSAPSSHRPADTGGERFSPTLPSWEATAWSRPRAIQCSGARLQPSPRWWEAAFSTPPEPAPSTPGL